MTVSEIVAEVCREVHGGPKWTEACHAHRKIIEAMRAAVDVDAIDAALDKAWGHQTKTGSGTLNLSRAAARTVRKALGIKR